MRLSIVKVTHTKLSKPRTGDTGHDVFMIKLYNPSKNFETTSYINKPFATMFDALWAAHEFAKHMDATKFLEPNITIAYIANLRALNVNKFEYLAQYRIKDNTLVPYK